MKENRSGKSLIYLLLIVLQLTLLQGGMQAVAAVPGNGEVHTVVCDTHHDPVDGTQGELHAAEQHDCCTGHMSLDCQYHCSAGGFAFVGQVPISNWPSPVTHFHCIQITVPDPVSARTLFRPPRHVLVV